MFDTSSWVLSRIGADSIVDSTLVQSLWGGYGELLRLTLSGGPVDSVILKRVIPPGHASHGVSDARKRRSYQVEQAWYRDGSTRCDEWCRVARCYATLETEGAWLLLLEDLQEAGFRPVRPPGREQIGGGLKWLAHFHARFLGGPPPGLWERGTYWHLETRRDEWARMPEGRLKEIAEGLDQRLTGCRYQTVLHGDAKPSNFCWTADGSAAAVDFQYVGRGCGIRDVAYFLDCCLGEDGCEREAEYWLNHYFVTLHEALRRDGHAIRVEALENEWRELFPVAWCDFCRFYEGWARPTPPGPFSRRQLDQVLTVLRA